MLVKNINNYLFGWFGPAALLPTPFAQSLTLLEAQIEFSEQSENKSKYSKINIAKTQEN